MLDKDQKISLMRSWLRGMVYGRHDKQIHEQVIGYENGSFGGANFDE